MLYRSAEIDKLKPCSRKELKNIGIRTIIDLRSSVEANRQSPLQQAFKVIHIPIPTGDMEYILKGVQEQKIKSDTVYRIVEQMNRELISNYTKEYRRIFDILLDKNNYPVVIHCSSGKGRTGIVSALVLASLGVDEDIIMEDYRLSNDYFNIPAIRLPASGTLARGHHHPLLGTRGFPECRHRRNGTKVWRYRHLPAKRHRSDKRRKKETARHSFNG